MKKSTNKPKEPIAASIGVAVASEKNIHGYLSEYHSVGETAKTTGEYAEEMAAIMMATNMGIKFSAQKPWNKRKKSLEMKGLMDITNVTQYGVEDEDGLWTTVVAAAVFVK